MYLRFIPNRNYSTCDRKNINVFLVLYGKGKASLCMLFIYDPNDIARCPNHLWLQHLSPSGDNQQLSIVSHRMSLVNLSCKEETIASRILAVD